jgi:hypothetical protein
VWAGWHRASHDVQCEVDDERIVEHSNGDSSFWQALSLKCKIYLNENIVGFDGSCFVRILRRLAAPAPIALRLLRTLHFGRHYQLSAGFTLMKTELNLMAIVSFVSRDNLAAPAPVALQLLRAPYIREPISHPFPS